MKENCPDYHQSHTRDFVEELMLRISQTGLPDEKAQLMSYKLKKLEELIEKADQLEKTSRLEYLYVLQQIVLDRTRCFLAYENLIDEHRKTDQN